MRLYRVLILLLLSPIFLTGCGDDVEPPEEPVDQIENGDIYGTVIDEESDAPIEGASVSIGGQVALTGADGKYVLQEIPFSDKIEVSVTSDDYMEYRSTISLNQRLMPFDVSLAPVDSPTAQILAALEALRQDIETLDLDRVPSIQSHLSEDYIAAPASCQACPTGQARHEHGKP